MKIQFESEALVIFESALFRTTTTLMIGVDHIILIDPNWFPIELEFIQAYIAKLHNTKDKYLFFTHSDYDHIVGYNFFKNYTTIASVNFVEQKTKQSILQKIQTIDDDNYTLRNYPIEFPKIDITIEPNQKELQLGNQVYQVGFILGHNDDSVYLLDETNKILIAGDYLSNIEFPYLYYSFEAYIESLVTLSGLIESNSVETLVPGHGDFTTSVEEMEKRVNDSLDYIHLIKEHYANKTRFDFESFVKRYAFPQVMRKFHDANLELLAKELGSA